MFSIEHVCLWLCCCLWVLLPLSVLLPLGVLPLGVLPLGTPSCSPTMAIGLRHEWRFSLRILLPPPVSCSPTRRTRTRLGVAPAALMDATGQEGARRAGLRPEYLRRLAAVVPAPLSLDGWLFRATGLGRGLPPPTGGPFG